MKRLTTDNPDGNFETMLNFVYGEDGWAHIRHDGENENVPLTEWAKKQCEEKGCFLAGSAEEIDETLCDCRMDCPDCPIALAYCFASQSVHMRTRLKRYEDVLFDEAGKELLSLDDLRKLAVSNDPLTLDELREMDGEPVWGVFSDGPDCYMIIKWHNSEFFNTFECGFLLVDEYGKSWLAYRRRPVKEAR